MAVVGGAPDAVRSGSRDLARAAAALGLMPAEVATTGGRAASASGSAPVSVAAERWAACWSRYLAALEVQTHAAAALAENAAADLDAADGASS